MKEQMTLVSEIARLDDEMALTMDESTRERIWDSAREILDHGPIAASHQAGDVCLALGYVQSGKTTSITAVIAAAADAGYRIVIALLGSTNLLLDQNRGRLEKALGVDERKDYKWVVEANPSGVKASKRIAQRLALDRVILIPVLKHAGRIRAVAETLATIPLGDIPALIIDDEADQASLNTAGQPAESKTYEAVRQLRETVPNHLYVQYTATPYAPLLLEAGDLLHPRSVVFLTPGPGYTGGREFFVDSADQVVRDVPMLDEQTGKTPPLSLPASLVQALASFIVGTGLLLEHDRSGAPVSMLVHSTARNDVQSRYAFLLERQISAWKDTAIKATSLHELPPVLLEERARLVQNGAQDSSNEHLLNRVRFVLREATMWVVNSEAALNKINWTDAPVHILVGGNKLDRGFTVEGLTVTYMNRPASPQVDTLEQRARAFGYRGDQLPYCQFFASQRTIRSLRDTVYTEYDLRAELRDHVENGGTVSSWAKEIGLLLPAGMKPTRDAVVQALSAQPAEWHSLRRPVLDAPALEANRGIVEGIGLLDAGKINYGRLEFQTIEMPLGQVVSDILEPWAVESYSPSWRHADIVQTLKRNPHQNQLVPILLMQDQDGPRKRAWDESTGFVNLFQGRDTTKQAGRPFYPGDLATPLVEEYPDRVVLQIHRLQRRIGKVVEPTEILTLGAYLGTRAIVRKG